jgi:1-acyl-sn-glycerol-3-phosphate acyltransferase
LIDRLQTLFYWLNVRTWVSAIVLIAAKRDVRGMDNVPRHGPLILVSNHFNTADPPVLTWAMPRRVVWMAKKELFDNLMIGTLFRLFGLIPVRRFEADLSALRKSLRALKRGQVLGMFPEGTRSAGKGLTAGEPGTAVLALRSGAPILPVAIWGTEHVKLPRDLLRRTPISVRFGQPFRLPETRRVTKAQVASGTDEIMRRIAELLPPQYRGVYGEQPAERSVAAATKEA